MGDHLVGQPCDHTERLDLVGERQTRQSLERLTDQLVGTPRSLHSAIIDGTPEYEYFTGGGDAARFRRNAWLHDKGSETGNSESRRQTRRRRFSFTDPGPDLRPGFLCEHPS